MKQDWVATKIVQLTLWMEFLSHSIKIDLNTFKCPLINSPFKCNTQKEYLNGLIIAN